jgi:hypothetical protein
VAQVVQGLIAAIAFCGRLALARIAQHPGIVGHSGGRRALKGRLRQAKQQG